MDTGVIKGCIYPNIAIVTRIALKETIYKNFFTKVMLDLLGKGTIEAVSTTTVGNTVTHMIEADRKSVV